MGHVVLADKPWCKDASTANWKYTLRVTKTCTFRFSVIKLRTDSMSAKSFLLSYIDGSYRGMLLEFPTATKPQPLPGNFSNYMFTVSNPW